VGSLNNYHSQEPIRGFLNGNLFLVSGSYLWKLNNSPSVTGSKYKSRSILIPRSSGCQKAVIFGDDENHQEMGQCHLQLVLDPQPASHPLRGLLAAMTPSSHLHTISDTTSELHQEANILQNSLKTHPHM
jgi:hypothetical protein